MTRAEAWTVHLAALGVGGTGLVYGWMRYFCEPVDEFALANHPLEPATQHLHLWLAPLLLFAVGLLWSEHVWKRVRTGFPARRPTGLVLFALFWPMVGSGVWVQLAEAELARTLAVWIHALTGSLWCLAYAVHLLSPRTARGGRA
jgi:hypothetical protein